MFDRTNNTTSSIERNASAPRRGSALLIVIGTLAIVAVFAAIYISIGQSDRRVATSIEKRQDTKELRNGIADHIAGVLGGDRLDFTARRADTGTDIFYEREAVDVPYTDWTMRSESANAWERFNPIGRHASNVGPNALEDARVASDPFLASTTPTYLGDPGQPSFGDDRRPFGSLFTELRLDPTEYIAGASSSGFLDKRDWLQISNLAPDGRFVNLFNLRPNSLDAGVNNNFSDDRVGGFDAEPGTGETARDDGRTMRRMSEYLSLVRPAGGTADDPEPGSVLRMFDPVDEGIWLPGRNEPVQGVLTDDEIVNTPAVWTMYQRFMFFPMNQAFVTKNRFNQLSTWADPDFPAYQYADADGDGMADSRWFELVSAQEPNSSSTNERDDIEREFDAQGTRVFAAARVVDLSSMVNVNTATDLLAIPDPAEGAPLGATPADIDLRRLLSMQDASENSAFRPAGGLSPMDVRRPPESRNWFVTDTDYWHYRATLEDSSVNTERSDLHPHAITLSIGRYAYDALKREIEGLTELDEDVFAWPPEVLNGRTEVDTDVSFFDNTYNSARALGEIQDIFDAPSTSPLKQWSDLTETAETRREYYENFGRIDPLRPNSVSGTRTNALYGIGTLSELLTYHGINDPAVRSRLEGTVAGRMPSFFEKNQRAFTPLFSNRSLRLDRGLHGVYDDAERLIPSTYPPGPPTQERAVGGRIAKESMTYFTLSPRRLLTTVSGHAPITPSGTVFGATNSLAGSGAPGLSSALGDASTLFGVYRGALAGEFESTRLGATFTADPPSLMIDDLSLRRTDPTAAEQATLFYGHFGPELALRISAHMALNMKDLNDGDTVPSVATLLMDEERRDDLEDETAFPDDETFDPTADLALDYIGRSRGVVFDGDNPATGATELPDADLEEHRRAMNVFGIEAMPVLTEVSTFYVFHDASISAGGDMDFRNLRPKQNPFGAPTPLPQPGTMPEITIDGDPDPVANPDCLMEGIAFQLHNPFDRSISLGGDGKAFGDPLTRIREPGSENEIDTDGADQFEFEYYIEWNGYFFKLAELVQYYPPSSNPEGQTFRDADQLLTGSGVNNPLDDFGPNDSVTATNGGYLDPDVYPDFVSRNITIGPGETRVFYAIADPRFDSAAGEMFLDNKWRMAMDAYNELPQRYTTQALTFFDNDNDGVPDGGDGRGWTGPMVEWLKGQFNSTGSRAVMVHPMNPQTGEYEPVSPYDLLGASPSHAAFDQLTGATGRRDATEARLWRKMVSPGETSNDLSSFPEGTKENQLHNDLLVDRLPLEMIAEPLAGSHRVGMSVGFPENYPNTDAERALDARNDNSGYSIVKWTTSGRRDSKDSLRPGLSQIREWALASRTDPASTSLFAMDEFTQTPDISVFRQSANPLDISDNSDVTDDYDTHLRLFSLWQENQALLTIGTPPHLKNTLDELAPGNGEGSMSKYGRAEAAAMEGDDPTSLSFLDNPAGFSLHSEAGPGAMDLRPELMTSSAGFHGAPRLTDLLMAWGVGPVHAPTSMGSLNDTQASYYADEWMTLPEALAVALGYVNPSASADGPDAVWNGTFTAQEQVLDNGRLRIDDYVAFLNDPAGDSVMGEPEFNLGIDIRRGSGAPMALGVVDRVRAVATNVTSGAGDAATQPYFGTVNINTAPVEVLRLLPGLTPSLTAYYRDNGSSSPTREWWGDDVVSEHTDLKTIERTPDVAALIAGYRDRVYVQPRARSMEIDPALPTLYDLNPVRYSSADDDVNAHATNMLGETEPVNPSSEEARDRATMSGIDGLRPTPGFGSLGEILAVTLSDEAEGLAGTAHRTRSSQLDIQQFGYDTLNLDGTSDTEILWDPQILGGDTNGASIDDYAERLAIASGVLNTISVRSDYFAVWFVMQVYQRSDVEGLLPQDPLVPSIEKRYLMVVDRTNVLSEGDAPRIVLLKEVPM